MKALVLGATGAVGRHIVESLLTIMKFKKFMCLYVVKLRIHR